MMKNAIAPNSRAAAEPDPRHDERHAGREHDQHRVEDQLELRDAEVELALEGRHADEQAARQPDDAQVAHPGQLQVHHAGGLHRPHDLGLDDGDRQQRHDRAADEHEVRRAPERDVLAEEAVPEVVEREGDEREAARETIIMTPPSGAYQSLPMRTAVGPGRSARSSRPRQIAKKPAAKMPYRPPRMKKWPGLLKTPVVAALVDVQRHVPVQAEQRRDERDDRQAAGQRGPRRLTGDALGEALEPAERGDQPPRWPRPPISMKIIAKPRDRPGEPEVCGRCAAGVVRQALRRESWRMC